MSVDFEANTHQAPLGAVLSLLTGVLLCELYEMYTLQDWLNDEYLFTHQRIEPARLKKDVLYAQFPLLAEAFPPDFGGGELPVVKARIKAWIDSVSRRTGYPLTVEVRRG